jgi:adenylate cyclase class 2
VQTVERAVHEVEVKYRVADPGAVVDALTRRGIALSAEVHQDDQAYAPVSWSYGMSKVGVPFARLRTQGGHHLFTVKRPVENELACLEHETVVTDREQMHHALITMGWAPTVRIVKRRRSAVWDGVSLCLDLVDGIGAFVELERMVGADESGESVQVALDAMVRSFGIAVQRTALTYDSLIRDAAACS